VDLKELYLQVHIRARQSGPQGAVCFAPQLCTCVRKHAAVILQHQINLLVHVKQDFHKHQIYKQINRIYVCSVKYTIAVITV
jgi:hypothetical protein